MGIVADRVKETTVTTGTGTYTVDGTTATWQSFVTGVTAVAGSPSPLVWSNVNYLCIHSDASGNNIDVEVGRGTLTDGGAGKDTLTRDTIVFSTNGGSAVDWGAGTKTIVNTAQAVDLGSSHYWMLSKTADQLNFAQTTNTKVVWETTDYSNGVTVDLASEKVTIAQGGDYVVGFVTGWDGDSGGDVQIKWYKNGVELSYVIAGVNDGSQQTISTAEVLTLAANDYLEVYIYNVDTGNGADLKYAASGSVNPLARFIGFLIPGT